MLLDALHPSGGQSKIEGTSELEDELHKAVELALDHVNPMIFGPDAKQQGQALHSALPPSLQVFLIIYQYIF